MNRNHAMRPCSSFPSLFSDVMFDTVSSCGLAFVVWGNGVLLLLHPQESARNDQRTLDSASTALPCSHGVRHNKSQTNKQTSENDIITRIYLWHFLLAVGYTSSSPCVSKLFSFRMRVTRVFPLRNVDYCGMWNTKQEIAPFAKS